MNSFGLFYEDAQNRYEWGDLGPIAPTRLKFKYHLNPEIIVTSSVSEKHVKWAFKHFSGHSYLIVTQI